MGQKYVTFEKRLANLGLFSLAKQQLNGDPTSAHSNLNGNCRDDKTKLLLILADGIIRGNNPRMQLGRFSLDFRKDLFARRVVQQWISLPRVITRGLVLLVVFDLAMKSGC